jgi:hypothetical protein
MDTQTTNATAVPTNGSSTARELFVLTDEQILEIQPDAQDAEVRAPASESSAGSPSASTTVAPDAAANAAPAGPFAVPEEVRALAELYPGGLSQAKTAAERARTLDEIDAAYFGGANSTPEQVSAARAQLAQRMMSENPAAFREMVFAGLRALEQASPGAPAATPSSVVAQHAAPLQENGSSTDASGETRAAYAAFERAANEELERGVGAAIERTIAQALPNLGREEGATAQGHGGGFQGLHLQTLSRQPAPCASGSLRRYGKMSNPR